MAKEPKKPHACLRCGYVWYSKGGVKNPKACPRCKSYRWDTLPSQNYSKSIESISEKKYGKK